MVRSLSALVLAFACAIFSARANDRATPASDGADLAVFLAELWSDAQARGITRSTFDGALADFTPDSRVIAATRRDRRRTSTPTQHRGTVCEHVTCGPTKDETQIELLTFPEPPGASGLRAVFGH